jgi:hypothetical protein
MNYSINRRHPAAAPAHLSSLTLTPHGSPHTRARTSRRHEGHASRLCSRMQPIAKGTYKTRSCIGIYSHCTHHHQLSSCRFGRRAELSAPVDHPLQRDHSLVCIAPSISRRMPICARAGAGAIMLRCRAPSGQSPQRLTRLAQCMLAATARLETARVRPLHHRTSLQARSAQTSLRATATHSWPTHSSPRCGNPAPRRLPPAASRASGRSRHLCTRRPTGSYHAGTASAGGAFVFAFAAGFSGAAAGGVSAVWPAALSCSSTCSATFWAVRKQ